MPRRNYLVRMRIAEVLNDGEWRSTDYIVDHFLTNGWSFINERQIASICSRTTGIDKRIVGKGRMFRLKNKAAFAEFMSV
tara:strand:- start:10 stop:249 length:240 start_codon:yes stop_codon:yes gene_type:complete